MGFGPNHVEDEKCSAGIVPERKPSSGSQDYLRKVIARCINSPRTSQARSNTKSPPLLLPPLPSPRPSSPSTLMSAASASPPPLESTDVESVPQPTTQPTSPRQQPSPASSPPHEPALICLWADCGKPYPDAEFLYNHLCNDHIGRKSTNNLCLTCNWKDCGATCAKRDHITSHLRGNGFFRGNPCSTALG